MPAHSPGARLGPYELVSLIGVGGMGEVWKARDTRVDRVVALKFAQSGFTERFEREGRAIAALNHPNICQLYDIGADYLVMEYVEGDPLRPLANWGALLEVATAIAGGLSEAHAAGIVHRDLKPDNILVRRDGVVKILDFGLAKRAGENLLDTRSMPVTAVGSVVGTVAYMSPEQATGRELDCRSDQFSFGLILYELAAGKRPFDRPSSAETMAAIIRDDPDPLPPNVPRPLAWIIERCLAKDPLHHYDSTRDLYRELASVRAHLSEITRTVAASSGGSGRRRRWLRDVAIAIAGLVAGAALVAAWRHGQSATDRSWSGVRLGGASISMSPRLSPDGHLLAFIALVNGTTELAVMEPGSESWTLLTHDSRDGYVQNVSWSHDGAKLYFDRYWGQPAGVYTMPPLGGVPVLLLDKAFEPQALPDNSLLVVRTSGSFQQLFRFWPQDGRLQPLQVFFDNADVAVPFRAFADGRRVVYWGRQRADSTQPRGLRVLDLDTGGTNTLDPRVTLATDATLSVPLAVTPDGASILTLARQNDTFDVIEIDSSGRTGYRVLLTLPPGELPWFFDTAADGSIYMDLMGRPLSIVRASPGAGNAEAFTAPQLGESPILPLGDRIVVRTGGGRPQMLIGALGSELRPFLQTDEPTNGPLTSVAADAIAFMLGDAPRLRVAFASIADGRILRETQLPGGAMPTSLAVSKDREIIYYAHNGSVFALPRSGVPRRLGEGDSVALEPAGRYLYVKQFARNPITIARIDVVSGENTPVKLPAEPRISPIPLSPAAVDNNGGLLVETSSPLMWFYRAGALDLRSGTITMVRMPQTGDCLSPGWMGDGSIVCNVIGLTGSLWHYTRIPADAR